MNNTNATTIDAAFRRGILDPLNLAAGALPAGSTGAAMAKWAPRLNSCSDFDALEAELTTLAAEALGYPPCSEVRRTLFELHAELCAHVHRHRDRSPR